MPPAGGAKKRAMIVGINYMYARKKSECSLL